MHGQTTSSQTNFCPSSLLSPDSFTIFCRRYSYVHMAAVTGRIDTLNDNLSAGIKPVFTFGTSNPLSTDYIPCPVYLAAVEDQSDVMDFLMALPECTTACKASAYLLQSTCHILRLPINSQNWNASVPSLVDKWKYYLRMIESEQSGECEFIYPKPVPAYQNQREIISPKDLEGVIADRKFLQVDIQIQCLLVVERCLGLAYVSPLSMENSLFSWIAEVALKFIKIDVDGEIIHRLLKHSSESFQIAYDSLDISNSPSYWSQALIMSHANYNYNGFLALLRQQTTKYRIDHAFFLNITVANLEKVITLSNTMCLKADSTKTLLKRIFYIVVVWIDDAQSASDDHLILRKDIDDFCSKFIVRFCKYPCGSTLLHYFIEYLALLNKELGFISLCLDIFLSCGGHNIINTPDWNGKKPIHFVASLDITAEKKIMLLSCLLSFGAHLDAVDTNGRGLLDSIMIRPQSDLSSFLCQLRPLPLFCHAARLVVAENLPYHHLGLPNHIINFVELHDHKCNNGFQLK